MILAAIAVASTVSAYQCPSTVAVIKACASINVAPLVCTNPKVNIEPCNEKQCTQTYVNDYSACQCRRSSTGFYESSVNVDGLLRRCGVAGLINPYGDPSQYRPGQGTQTFSRSSTTGGATATSRTADPSASPSERSILDPVRNTSHHISKGAIAGIVLGLLAATALAGLLGWCWRKRRHDHMAVYNSYPAGAETRGPSRTVVTEKIEPIVVKTSPGTTGPTTGGYNTGATTSSAAHNPMNTTATNNYNTTSTHAPHNTGAYNSSNAAPAATTQGYSTQPRTG
ncbi:hypothetical protein BCR41DRAFT_387743 [Lobosporangium transversale]|uniref:Uncharacterized protein n=1 Tax=Lobosporangium transversale TaxID=64571 RepID=A0A1Y2GHV4_9FUNG|nr:hypothetical protein BCR41DRAFT_387743 [Lobosporangium transversale]ORZ11286.1 hypothetical protein BCR41DRAFT_387743 [Lobosporangium transversale]|eukprot:XP_021879601.1 hypothetical protein BCR41DRAFT_387743 [Lobosporangium transversale]